MNPEENKNNTNNHLHSEFIEFMNKHSVYETIPENMKVK
jgi:hypothetical protein